MLASLDAICLLACFLPFFVSQSALAFRGIIEHFGWKVPYLSSGRLASFVVNPLHAHEGLSDAVGWWEAKSVWLPAKNTLLFLACVPSCTMAVRFLWSFRLQSWTTVVMLMPLGLPAVFLADLFSTSLLGAVAVFGASAQLILAQQLHKQGMKLI